MEITKKDKKNLKGFREKGTISSYLAQECYHLQHKKHKDTVWNNNHDQTGGTKAVSSWTCVYFATSWLQKTQPVQL